MRADLIRLSKRVSRVLRHDPGSVGLRLDAAGWVPVDDLVAALNAAGAPVTRAELDAVVAGNDKQRYAVRVGPDGVAWIRANQGHSRRVPVELGLATVPPPGVLYHGTPTRNLPSIMAYGLRPGRRHHVHLSADVHTAEAVGRRGGTDVAVLAVAAGPMAADGHAFHRSANGVWLTTHVPPRWLTRHEYPKRA